MNLNGGYVKLFRKTLRSQVFANEGLFHLWVWCLLKASHKEEWVTMQTGSGQTEVKIGPGQFVYGRKAAAKELRAKPSTIRDRLKKLERIGNITTQPATHFTIVSIVNWDTYQVLESETRQATQQPGDNQATTRRHIQEVKEHKEIKDMSFLLKKDAEIVLARINELSGKKYTDTKPIEAVMKAKDIKASVEDCHKVVDYKWKDEFIREKYFTPASLFRKTKFQTKLDEANNAQPVSTPKIDNSKERLEELLS
jgi:uncharacterized phage protein (TIGR02220 family)